MRKRKAGVQGPKKTSKKSPARERTVKVASKQPLSAVHPWRVCSYGEHWVRTHPLHVPPSKTHAQVTLTTRHGHCAHNPSGRDQLYREEMQEIAKKDHLITVTKEELNDPTVNICAGVRWLFEKRRLASVHLKKVASWVETVWEYKGLSLASSKKKAEEIKVKFNHFYEELQKCGKD